MLQSVFLYVKSFPRPITVSLQLFHAGLLAQKSSYCYPSRYAKQNISGFLAALPPYSDGNRAGLSPASLLADHNQNMKPILILFYTSLIV